MKSCPQCQRTYLDAQSNCQFDGAPLVTAGGPPPGQYQQQQYPPPPPGAQMQPPGYPPTPGYPPPPHGYPSPQGGWQPGYPPPAYGTGMGEYVPCPSCRTPDPEQVKFTWWGGLLGPKMLKHVKCRNCKTTYNGKTGQSNTTGIVIYSIVAFIIFFALTVVIILALGR